MKLIPTILFALTCIISNAQEGNGSYTKDLGFNTYFVLRGILETDQTPFSLMYKKYKSETKATRLGISLSGYHYKTSGDNSTNYVDQSSISLALSFGKEFQKNLDDRNKWIWYYGGDIIPNITYFNQDYYINNDKYQETTIKGFGLSARPFLGIRWNLNPRLYIAAEASASLGYSFRKNDSKLVNPETILQDTKSNNLGINMNGASGIFLFYRF
jgi:hypothetical protein